MPEDNVEIEPLNDANNVIIVPNSALYCVSWLQHPVILRSNAG
jgi:hypothetical protein